MEPLSSINAMGIECLRNVLCNLVPHVLFVCFISESYDTIHMYTCTYYVHSRLPFRSSINTAFQTLNLNVRSVVSLVAGDVLNQRDSTLLNGMFTLGLNQPRLGIDGCLG